MECNATKTCTHRFDTGDTAILDFSYDDHPFDSFQCILCGTRWLPHKQSNPHMPRNNDKYQPWWKRPPEESP